MIRRLSIIANFVLAIGLLMAIQYNHSETKRLLDFIDGHEFYPLMLSAYNSEKSQTNSRPFETASGTRTSAQTLALSRDLISHYNSTGIPTALTYPEIRNGKTGFNYGDTVIVIVAKKFIVEDTMNKRYTERGDIWTENRDDALAFGVQEGMIIKKKNAD